MPSAELSCDVVEAARARAAATYKCVLVHDALAARMCVTASSFAAPDACRFVQANTPFDVVKSRMQNQLVSAGTPNKYNWTIPSMSTVYAEEGLGALYKGIIPRYTYLRALPVPSAETG